MCLGEVSAHCFGSDYDLSIRMGSECEEIEQNRVQMIKATLQKHLPHE
jgi:hypothetical protein